MVQNASLEMLAFNVKMLGHGRKKRLLISAGQTASKKRMLPAIQDLLKLEVEIFATPGTHRFFSENGIPSTLIHKISDSAEPNILSFLKDDRFDLVINILTGDEDYDASSDAKLIRGLSIENGIPLITDTDVGIATLSQIVKDAKAGTYQYKMEDESRPWDLRLAFHKYIQKHGGYANHHAHFDKAYLISEGNLKLGQVDMQKKWELYRYLKENYTHEDLVERISRALQTFVDQGATYCRTMVDADSIAGLKPIIAAREVQKRFKDKIHFEIGVQPLEGVLDPKTFEMYHEACTLADYCGGLPSRDRPHPEKHLDVILELAKKLGKPLDIHIDQENNPLENETELLADKVIEHGMQGRVFGVHAVSLAAKEEREQDRIIEKIAAADLGIIICPSAAISMKQLDMKAPLHNSIAPFPKLKAAGVRCYLGVDNINDLFMPIVDGDMWTECRFLMEACRHYVLEDVAEWACARPVTAMQGKLSKAG